MNDTTETKEERWTRVHSSNTQQIWIQTFLHISANHCTTNCFTYIAAIQPNILNSGGGKE